MFFTDGHEEAWAHRDGGEEPEAEDGNGAAGGNSQGEMEKPNHRVFPKIYVPYVVHRYSRTQEQYVQI